MSKPPDGSFPIRSQYNSNNNNNIIISNSSNNNNSIINGQVIAASTQMQQQMQQLQQQAPIIDRLLKDQSVQCFLEFVSLLPLSKLIADKQLQQTEQPSLSTGNNNNNHRHHHEGGGRGGGPAPSITSTMSTTSTVVMADGRAQGASEASITNGDIVDEHEHEHEQEEQEEEDEEKEGIQGLEEQREETAAIMLQQANPAAAAPSPSSPSVTFAAGTMATTTLPQQQQQQQQQQRALPACRNKAQALALFKVLFKYCGIKDEEEEEKMGHKCLDKRALCSMKIITYMTIYDEHFQDVIEEQTISTFKLLRIHRHVLFEHHIRGDTTDEEEMQHKMITAKFVLFVSTNIKRFRIWKKFVKERAHKAVSALMDQEQSNEDAAVEPIEMVASRGRLSSEFRLPPAITNYYDVDVQQICHIFNTSLESGLPTAIEVERRRHRYGVNQLPKPKRPSFIVMLLKQLLDFMVIILILTAILAAALQDWAAAVTLILVVMFNVLVGYVQEVKAELRMRALMKLSIQNARVIRHGQVEMLDAQQLVPGDIVLLEEGDQVPADLRMVEEIDLHIIESLLTGESDPVEKNIAPINKRNVTVGDRHNMAFMSTMVTKGRGKGVVVAVGKGTEIGKISKTLQGSKTKKTAFQTQLTVLGIVMVIFSVVLCALTAGIGIAYGRDIVVMIKIAVSLAVSVIPEGLVAVSTVTMALGVQRMAKKRAIVRQINAVETLGSVTVICSDKTGTLTEGKMKTTNIWTLSDKYAVRSESMFTGAITLIPKNSNVIGTKSYKELAGAAVPVASVGAAGDSDAAASQPLQPITKSDIPPILQRMLLAMALCNNSTIQFASEDDDKYAGNKSKKGSKKKDKKQKKKDKKSANEDIVDLELGEIDTSTNNPATAGALVATSVEPDDDNESVAITTATTAFDNPQDPQQQSPDAPTAVPAKNGHLEALGDPTEVALHLASHYIGLNKTAWIQEQHCAFVNEFAFDSVRKRMTVVYNVPKILFKKEQSDDDEQQQQQQQKDEEKQESDDAAVMVAMSKGSTEGILSISTHYINEQGLVAPLTLEATKKLEQLSLSMAGNGLRVLAIAYKDMGPAPSMEELILMQKQQDQQQLLEDDADGIVVPPVENDSIAAAAFDLERVEHGLIVVGFAGLLDPPRVGVSDSIAVCSEAGIRVAMITGDHPRTALSIAEALSIVARPGSQPAQQPMQAGDEGTLMQPIKRSLDSSVRRWSLEQLEAKSSLDYIGSKRSLDLEAGRAMTTPVTAPPNIAAPTTTVSNKSQVLQGKDIDGMVVAGTLKNLNPFPSVFARVSPENKMQLVEALQKRGEIVAMIGDGVNDAMSIRKANVGVSMGVSGTDLAKQASHVVLADDNFSTIVEAVREGRRTYDNIKKFIMYLLSCNLAEILVTFIAVCANLDVPFSAIQILYANLVADSPCAMALGVEPADRGIMDRLPRNPKGGIFNLVGWLVLSYQALVMFGISFAAFIIATHVENYNLELARTYTFAVLTTMQLVHAFHSRSNTLSLLQKNPFSNVWMYIAFLVSFGAVIAGIYIPGFNTALELQPLGWWEWVKVLIALVIHAALIEIMKLVLRARRLILHTWWTRRHITKKFFSEL